MSVHFHSIFPQTSLFGVQLHIEAPTGLATFHASTCDVNNPSIMPLDDITAIMRKQVVYDTKYIILEGVQIPNTANPVCWLHPTLARSRGGTRGYSGPAQRRPSQSS
jgi:hypothetical protein